MTSTLSSTSTTAWVVRDFPAFIGSLMSSSYHPQRRAGMGMYKRGNKGRRGGRTRRGLVMSSRGIAQRPAQPWPQLQQRRHQRISSFWIRRCGWGLGAGRDQGGGGGQQIIRWRMSQYLCFLRDGVSIEVVIRIRSNCWEGSKETVEATMKNFLTILAILIPPLIKIFSTWLPHWW